jgi:glycerophosphoryl diester phosphodiesterase
MENSLSALRRAVTEGYRYLETDVHATRDGVPIVLHDPTLDRTTDGRGTVAELGWHQVRRARIGGRDPVCRLADLLEELPTVLLNIDVKADSAVDPVLELMRCTQAWNRVCLASFSERRLRWLRRAAGPRLLTSMGIASVVALRVRSLLPWLPLHLLLPLGAHLAQVPLRRCRVPVVDPALLRHARRYDIEVHVWTVDDPEVMGELLDAGVDGLVTDRPDLLRDVLARRGSWPPARQ